MFSFVLLTYQFGSVIAVRTHPIEERFQSAPWKMRNAMQTHSQGPWEVGFLRPMSDESMSDRRKELAAIKLQTGWEEPDRGDSLTNPNIEWRFGVPPDYTLANLEYMKYKITHWPQGSLEHIVENIVKTWEFERSHKVKLSDHTVANKDGFRLRANDGRWYDHAEAHDKGNYNVLMDSCDKALWNSDNVTNRESHEIWHKAFPAFPWEVLKVYTAPPKVHFEWRHFGRFTGTYGEYQGDGSLIDMRGYAVAEVNEKLQLLDTQIYYDEEKFLRVMRGEIPPSEYGYPLEAKAIDNKTNWYAPETTLYARIGKAAATGTAVNLFYMKILADPEIAPAFVNHDMAKQKAHLVKFFEAALGGPDEYSSLPELETVHKQVLEQFADNKETMFNSMAKYLVETLQDLRISQTVIDEIAGIVLSAKDAVFANVLISV